MRSKIIFVIVFLTCSTFLLTTSHLKNESKIYQVIPSTPSDDWFERQRAFPFDEIPQSEYLKALNEMKNMNIYQQDNLLAWQLAGPTNIEGRITTIVIHPLNPQIVYTGTANGGIWKSTNFCQSWISVFDNQNTSSIGALAIDPINPEIIYSGTGESNSLRSYYPGTGIYKSTNGGINWTFQGLGNTYSFGNICINPQNSQEIYAAALGSLRRKNIERGVYKSTNGGLSWNSVLYHSDSVGAIDVILNPALPSKIFAAMWERQRREDYIKYGGPMTALYVSTNSGINWSVVSGGFPSNDPTLGRISLDICNSNPLVIYALTAYANGNSRGLYKSSDGGSTWSLINSSAAGSSNYAWFNRICKVNPVNPDVLYCGGLNMERSLSGGVSFSTVSTSHVDQHAVAFAPSNPNYVIIGNDGGIDYSTNGGSSWIYSNSLPITQFYAGEIDNTNPNTILGGSQDNGTNRTISGGLNDWTSIYGGDGFYCLVDYTNPQRVYASSQNGGLGRSTNGGSSFMGATSGLDRAYTNWMTPYVMDKNNPLILYCGTYKIHRTTNGMQNWTAISPDLPGFHQVNLGTITTVDVSKSNPDVVYCGTDNAKVWVTTNAGAGWNQINSGLPYRWVTRVAIHPDSANVCYVTLSGYKVDSTGAHIFKTVNYGQNWVSISGNLPDAPINDVIISPYDYNTLYIATDVGVIITTNTGANWSLLGTGFPSSIPSHDLTFHAPTGKLVVWTHGRSAYSLTITPPSGIQNLNEPSVFELRQNFPNPFNPNTTIIYKLKLSASVKLSVYDVTGRLISELINKKQTSGVHRINFSANGLSSGVYFYKIEVEADDNNQIYSDIKKLVILK